MKLHKILCAIDYSAGAREGLRMAAELARDTNSDLVLVHVWQIPYVLGADFPFPDALAAESKAAASRELGAWQAEAELLGAPRVTSTLRTGVPWHEIIALAKQDRTIDLLVMGTHGLTGLKHVLVGSVADKVVRHAPCPVLVAREREHEGGAS